MDPRHRWRIVDDALPAVIVTAAGLAEVWVPFDSVQGDGSPASSTLVIVAGGILLALRRRFPIGLAGIPLLWLAAAIVAAGHIQVLFFGGLVPMYAALFWAARHAARRTGLVVCGCVFGVVLAGDVFIAQFQGVSERLFHWGLFLAVVAVALGLRFSARRVVDATLRASDAEDEARESALRAVAEERTRIARELHDVLAHSVSVMVVQAGAAAQVIDDDPAFARRALEAIRTTGSQSLDEVRRVVSLLRDDAGAELAPPPGIAEMPELVARARSDGIAVELAQTGTARALSPGQQLSVYRIIQEALTNIRKHAPGASVRIDLRYARDAVEVIVADDGAGVQASGNGHGLVGMHERVALYGGTLEAGPQGDGWRVRAVVPVA